MTTSDLGNQYQVDRQRAYLIEYSNGGSATLNMIERYPGLFAAGVSVSGGGSPNPSTVEALKDVPLLFIHGSSDSVVSPSSSINMVNALLAAGGDAGLLLVGGGHDSGFEVGFRDPRNQVYPWLFSQTLPVPERP